MLKTSKYIEYIISLVDMKIILLDLEFYVLKYNFQLLCTQLKTNKLLKKNLYM